MEQIVDIENEAVGLDADAISAARRLKRNPLITKSLTSEWPSMAQLQSDFRILTSRIRL